MGKASQRTPGVVADAEGVVVEPEPVQNIPEFCLHGFGHRRLGSGTITIVILYFILLKRIPASKTLIWNPFSTKN
jgi:hypothetical protein